MDIKEIGGSLLLPSAAPKKEGGGSLEFQKMLQDARQSLSGGDSASPVGTVPGAAQGFEISPVNGLLEIQDRQQLQAQSVAATENTIALLEQYQQALADPEQTLKQIDPLVHSLSEKVTVLQELSQKLAPADPLRRLVEDVGMVSAMEIEKFKRGDYV